MLYFSLPGLSMMQQLSSAIVTILKAVTILREQHEEPLKWWCLLETWKQLYLERKLLWNLLHVELDIYAIPTKGNTDQGPAPYPPPPPVGSSCFCSASNSTIAQPKGWKENFTILTYHVPECPKSSTWHWQSSKMSQSYIPWSSSGWLVHSEFKMMLNGTLSEEGGICRVSSNPISFHLSLLLQVSWLLQNASTVHICLHYFHLR